MVFELTAILDLVMAKIWKEPRRKEGRGRGPKALAEQLHGPMAGGFCSESVPPADVSRDVGLDPVWSYYVTVCSFTFEFWSVEQIEEALRYFSQKVPASPRYPMGGRNFLQSHQYTLKAWFERLPAGLHSQKSKDRIVKALSKAIEEFRK